MTATRHILCVIGTRPEAIKMAPVIQALRRSSWAEVSILVTGQHRELLRDALATFQITPDTDLDVMTENQTLASLTARLCERLDPILALQSPDMVLAQGDTTTVMVTSLLCHYRHIPFGHVEAGLRSGNLRNPFPEEMNRIVAGVVADLHFAPTPRARDALLRQGIAPHRIAVTGNTVIDALLDVAARVPRPAETTRTERTILLTMHRRESFGSPMRSVLAALLDVVDATPDARILFPVHPNPSVRAMADDILGRHPRVTLAAPMTYETFVQAMMNAMLIVSDSGGVQEEAPALGKPVLVVRDETERPEAVEAGVARLIGTDPGAVRTWVHRLLTDEGTYRAMARGVSPYGDGAADGRIADGIAVRLGMAARRQTQDWTTPGASKGG